MSTIDARYKALQSAPMDMWIALSEDETAIVAQGSTYSEAVENSEKVGVADPVMIKTPKVWTSFSV